MSVEEGTSPISQRGNPPTPRGQKRVIVLLFILLATAAIVSISSLTSVRSPAARFSLLELLLPAYTYLVLLVTCVTIAALLTIASRSFGNRSRFHFKLIAFAASLLLGLALVEASAWLCLSYQHRHPRLTATPAKTHNGQSTDSHSAANLLVIGESSAEGVPYRDWVSVGKIVTWQLRSSIPNRMFHVDVQARAGWTLERMHHRLAELRQAPDVLIVYAGHNEFASRFGWSSQVPYYDDELERSLLARAARRIADASPFHHLLAETLDAERVAARPTPAPRKLVDAPSCSPIRAAQILDDFRSRLEAVLDFCDRSGTVAVLVIPPGNDSGFEPNRSILPPETPALDRDLFGRAFLEAAAWETADPARGRDAYTKLIAWQPGFAESHFRLARLLEKAGKYDDAFAEYIKARDLDGHPMRCTSPFQQVYRDLAARHQAILIDGPAEFRASHSKGQLNDDLLNDGFHPSLEGQVILATAILRELQSHRVFNWPANAPSPKIDLVDCARHFDVTDAAWESVCEFAAGFYQVTAPIRFDPAERLRKYRLYENAQNQIAAGTPANHLNLPGIGTSNPQNIARLPTREIPTLEKRAPSIHSN